MGHKKGLREGGYSLASGLRDFLAQCTYTEQLGGRSMQQRRAVRFMIHQKEEGEKERKKRNNGWVCIPCSSKQGQGNNENMQQFPNHYHQMCIQDTEGSIAK